MRVAFTILLFAVVGWVRAARLPLGFELDGGPNTTEDGMVVVGDMIMPDKLHQYLNSPKILRKIIGMDEYKWPEENDVPTVPFVISSSALSFDSEIRAGMKHWEQHTCIRFREVDQVEDDPSYVEFIKGNGCWSYVGRLNPNAKQQVSIGNGCQMLGTVVHEIGHAVGFIHEQMRPDRDDYLNIHLENVDSDRHNQFNKFTAAEYFSYNVEYDYTSVMQYAGMDFSNNGKLTMITKDPQYQGLLGSGEVLSHRDKLVVNTHYGCIAKWEYQWKKAIGYCQNDGYLGDDGQCVCPPGTNGDTCEVVAETYYANAIPECSRVIKEETEIESPNYPSKIQEGSWCVYQIEAPEGKVVQLTFDNFSLEQYRSSGPWRCATAFLEIRVHDQDDGQILCGTDIKKQQSFVSSSRKMVLYLDTPLSSNSDGFKANISFVEDNTTETSTLTDQTTEGSASNPTTNVLVVLVVVSIILSFVYP